MQQKQIYTVQNTIFLCNERYEDWSSLPQNFQISAQYFQKSQVNNIVFVMWSKLLVYILLLLKTNKNALKTKKFQIDLCHRKSPIQFLGIRACRVLVRVTQDVCQFQVHCGTTLNIHFTHVSYIPTQSFSGEKYSYDVMFTTGKNFNLTGTIFGFENETITTYCRVMLILWFQVCKLFFFEYMLLFFNESFYLLYRKAEKS